MFNLPRPLLTSRVLLVSLLTLAACSKSLPQNTAVQAAPLVGSSFKVLALQTQAPEKALSVQDHALLQISKSALEKEFLLHGNRIEQMGIPTSHGMQSRIVAFKQVQDQVILLEASQGHVVTQDLPTQLVLATFPILEDSHDLLTIDFNAGMHQALTAGDWHASDMEGTTPGTSNGVASLGASYIDSINTVENEIEIRQIAQIAIEDPKLGPQLSANEFRYYLSPYRPTPGFVSRESSDFTRVGFFESASQYENATGRSLTYIGHWDDSKIITYAISSNTPAEFVDSVRDGILYWNKAFGREVVRVVMAPAGVTAPQPGLNIVQWVPNDNTGSAYADALLDPRTGEVRHAQVFINSGLAVTSRSQIPTLMRRLGKSSTASALSLTPKFMHSSDLCDYDASSHLVEHYQGLITQGADDATIARVSRDYIRYVAAHEVGHTFGLRHNFAGSLAETVNILQRNELFKTYLATGQVSKKEIFTSSIMEYAHMIESSMTGAQIAQSEKALPYDQMAIHWGYMGEEIDPKTAPLFCTDSHALVYKDCVRFDSGADPIVASKQKQDLMIEALPINLIEKFIAAKTEPSKKDRKAIEAVVLDPSEFTEPLVTLLKDQLAWMQPGGIPSIQMERKFPYVSAYNEKEIVMAEQTWVRQQLTQAGEVSGVLFSLLPSFEKGSPGLAKKALVGLNAALSRSDIRSGMGYNGTPYTLSDSEVAFIRDAGQKLFKQIEAKLIAESIQALSSTHYANEISGPEIESALSSLAKAIVLTQSDQIILGKDFKMGSEPHATPTNPTLHAFEYPIETRVAAISLLLPNLGTVIDWSEQGLAELLPELAEVVKKDLGVELKDLNTSEFSRAQAQWLAEQIKILSLIKRLTG